MNKQSPRNELSSMQRKRLLMASAGIALVSALSFGGASYAQETAAAQVAPVPQKMQHHHKHHGKMNPEQSEKRMSRMLHRLVPDATAEQKTKLAAIAKSAFDDLRPIQEKSREARTQGMKLLAQANIDRNAVEQLRQTQQQLADQRSRRMTQAYADAAEVLTPAQRVKAVEQMSKHGHRSGHGKRHHMHKHERATESKTAQ